MQNPGSVTQLRTGACAHLGAASCQLPGSQTRPRRRLILKSCGKYRLTLGSGLCLYVCQTSALPWSLGGALVYQHPQRVWRAPAQPQPTSERWPARGSSCTLSAPAAPRPGRSNQSTSGPSHARNATQVALRSAEEQRTNPVHQASQVLTTAGRRDDGNVVHANDAQPLSMPRPGNLLC